MSRGVEEARRQIRQSNGGGNEEAKKERKDEIRHLEKEASQLANYYFVFQGVIFTAIYHEPSRLKCGYKWIPFTLSALAGFLNLCALSRIALKYKRTLDEADAIVGDSIAVKCARWWRCFYVVACMLVVLVFLAVTLAGCCVITCSANT